MAEFEKKSQLMKTCQEDFAKTYVVKCISISVR